MIELVTVIVVVGILAAASAPAFSTLSASRRAAAAGEIRRHLLVVRSTAMASGRPTGLALASGSALTPMQIETPGASPVALMSPLGSRATPVSIAGLYPGTSIQSASLGSGDTGSVTFWFAYDGTPHTRSSSGTSSPAWTTDGQIAMTGGTVVTVRRISGVIE